MLRCIFHSDKLSHASQIGGTFTVTWGNTIGGHGAMYGHSVSLSGSFLAVGSPSDNFEFKNDQGIDNFGHIMTKA